MRTYDNRTVKEKIQDFGYSVKEKVRGTANYLKENKEVLLVVLPLVGVAITGAVKLTSKVCSNYRAETIKKKYIYDPSGGFYWPTKRALTGAEKLELDTRHRNGESLGQILVDMKLLKM